MNSPITGIRTEQISLDEFQAQPVFYKDSVLGIIHFSASYPHVSIENNLPAIQLIAPVLEGDANACEVWLSEPGKVLKNGYKGAIQYRMDDELLFGVINLEEVSIGQPIPATGHTDGLQIATEMAYQQILALINELGYPHLYRFWNYMADINGHSNELERYRHFNVGRKHVFAEAGRESGDQLPAACALGLAQGPLSIAFLVGRTAAHAIENPRQVSAYEYPDQYGPRTPSFSRATLLVSGQHAMLFISGTASIVGHQTKHHTDVAGQTMETLTNLEAVVAEANRIIGEPILNLQAGFFRVYIRHAADLSTVRSALQHHFSSEIKAVFVQADICRAELLLEIEMTIHAVTKSI